MPIYEYVCRNCGNQLEQLQKLSDAALTDCPACGESALKRKVSAASFRLAGSGWYETDFKSHDRRNIAGDSETKPKSGDPGNDKSGNGMPDSAKSSDTAKTDKPQKADKAGKADASKPVSSAGVGSA